MISVIYVALMFFSLASYLATSELDLNEALLLTLIIVFGILSGHYDGRDVEKRKGKSQ
jgi:uncharacterized membrane protein